MTDLVPRMEDAPWLLLVTLGALFALAALVAVIRGMGRLRALDSYRNEIAGVVEGYRADVELVDRVRNMNIDLLGPEDIEEHVEKIDRLVAEIIRNNAANPGFRPEHARLIVNYFHEPRDVQIDAVVQSNVRLLRGGFRLLWVYSANRVPTFRDELCEQMRQNGLEDHVIASQCRFKPMDPRDEITPVTFSVAAPLHHDQTIAYIGLRGDEEREFALRVANPGLLGGQLDRLSLYHIAQLPEHDPAADPIWQAIVERAYAEMRALLPDRPAQ